jgi:anti-sigma B factor antagonist
MAPPLKDFACSSARIGDVQMVAVAGELDVATAPAVERELSTVESTDVQAIVLDLSGATFIDGAGVQLLPRAAERSRSDANRLRLLRGPAGVQRVFRLADVERHLPFVD